MEEKGQEGGNPRGVLLRRTLGCRTPGGTPDPYHHREAINSVSASIAALVSKQSNDTETVRLKLIQTSGLCSLSGSKPCCNEGGFAMIGRKQFTYPLSKLDRSIVWDYPHDRDFL